MFRPYLLKQDGMETGSVYQTIHKEGVFKSYEYHHMVKDGMLYDLFPIGFGDEGGKWLVYFGREQIAQVKKTVLSIMICTITGYLRQMKKMVRI